MPSKVPAAAAIRQEWTLIRNARQLLTLQGPSGARRGPAIADPGIVSGASVLIHNGVIAEVGPARRIENLAAARRATEVDASGKVVLPAFIDAAATLLSGETRAVRTMSKNVLQARVESSAMAIARHGCLTIGARTPEAPELRIVTRILRAHQAQQARPLRIRSVLLHRFSPVSAAAADPAVTSAKWLDHVRQRTLVSVVEFDFAEPGVAGAAATAAGLGYALRFRSESAPRPADLRLALAAGAISVTAPGGFDTALAAALATAGCVRIYPAHEALEPSLDSAANIRRAICAGAAIALASDALPGDPSSGNLRSLLPFAVSRLGLTIGEAITATTWNPACALRLANATGSIETGKSADLVILNLDDYRELALPPEPSAVKLVMRAGVAVFGH